MRTEFRNKLIGFTERQYLRLELIRATEEQGTTFTDLVRQAVDAFTEDRLKQADLERARRQRNTFTALRAANKGHQ